MIRDTLESAGEASSLTTICRLTGDEDGHWRVMVESWPDAKGYLGRLVFARELGALVVEQRTGPTVLSGGTHEDVVAAAHELSERRIREVLHSLAGS